MTEPNKMIRTKKTTTPSNTPKTIPTVPEAEWPYQVPANWRWVRLDSIAEKMSDGPFGSNLKTEHYTTNKEVRIIQLSNIGEDGWRDENVKYTTFEHAKEIQRSIVNPGELVIAKMMPAGRAIICPNDEKMYILSSDAVKLVPIKNINTKYLLYTINSPFFRNQVHDNTQGITRARTSINKLKDYPIPLPPLAEQQRIVDRIERLFAKLDEAREKAQAVVDGFENRKAAILHQAFTGELTKKWREERGIGMESWKRIPLAELCERIFDGPFGSNLKTEDYVDSGIRVVRLENIKNLWFDDSKQSFVTKEKYRTIENHTVYSTDLIMATFISDEIKICQMPSYIGYAINKSDCVGIRLKESIIHRYVLFYLSSKDVYNILLKNIHGATRPRVNTKQIKSIIIPTASLVEQTIIVQEIEKLFSQERRARDFAESVIAQIDGMKKAILARAFRGELGTNVPGEAACEVP